MKTLQIGDAWLPEQEGGLARYYYELARHLPATGTAVSGLVVGTRGPKCLDGCEITAFAQPEDSMLTRLRAARRASITKLNAGQIDLICSHFALYGLPIADKLRTTPTVVHFHGPWASESNAEGLAKFNSRIKRAVENVVYSRAVRFITLTNAFKQEMVERYGVPESAVRVIPGGIDIDRFNMTLTRREARERLNWPTDRPIILCIRRQVRRMGLENLVDAVKQLVRHHPDVLVLLGGSGPLVDELRQRIAGHGLENNVKQLGRVADADLPTAYRAADLSVVPSQSLEGFGLITLESLASGTPVLVSPVGGLPEVVEPFAPRCIFGGITADAIASTLIEALNGNGDWPTDEACRKYAVDGFSWPRIAERVKLVYEEALR